MPLIPPSAPQRPHPITQHGLTRVDEYYWLRNREDPEVMDYIKEENRYLEAVMAHTRLLQERLFAELKGRIPESDYSVPQHRGGYEYFTRMEPGKQYPVYLRKRRGPESVEEVLLDQNELAEGQAFCAIAAFEVSPDGAWLAYMVDYSGSEEYTLYFKDLVTGQLLAENIPNTICYPPEGKIAWAEDSRTLFYTTSDLVKRPDKVYRHTLGTDPAGDALVYHEPDEAFYAFLEKTRSEDYIILTLRSQDGTELRLIPADRPESEPLVLQPRRKGLVYSADHLGDQFLIVTNEDALNFKLMSAPIEDPRRENWLELIPHREDTYLEEVHAFHNHVVLLERRDGLKQVRISEPDGNRNARYVAFPEPAYDVNLAGNPEFDTETLRFTYSSLVTPNSVVDYGLETGEWVLRKRDQIPSGYDPDLYQAERIFAQAPDGRQVPISLVYRRGLLRDGTNPCLLTAYGAYGYSFEPSFKAERLSLLERGFVFAIAHIRGGSELGRRWYEDGRRLNKKNSFTDFIACAEHLIAAGYTRREKLAIFGRSAGGLLMGAALTLRPDLFRAVVAPVPFVDVVTTMSDPSIPLTVTEYDQWGNPAEREVFAYLLSYSPYDNLRPVDYPDLLVTTGLNDSRVAFWEPAKFVARLRAVKAGDSLVLLKTDFESGHSGPSGRYNALKETSLLYAFVLDRLGVRVNSPAESVESL